MLRRLAIPGAYLMVVIAFTVSTWLAYNRVRATDNRTRCSIVAITDQLVSNARRNVSATNAAPTATSDQKVTAERNLTALIDLHAGAVIALHHPSGKACP